MAETASFSGSPYPGLRSFRIDESDIFFGREEQTDALLKTLQETRFLAVVGPSGCGKSSLVRAGLLAALETGFIARAGSRWRIAEMRPGDRPMARLAASLPVPSVLGPDDAGTSLALREAVLRRGPRGLIEATREASLPPGDNVLLLVDQFEEIFRFRGRGNSDEADAFVALLLASAHQDERPIYVVITMRSDFLGDCTVFRGLPEAINGSQYLTPRLTREQCQQAITGPARVFGGRVDGPLVNRLLNDFGPDPDQLPLLQHALMRMWDLAAGQTSGEGGAARGGVTLTLDDYGRLGGLNRALSDHADETMRSLSAPQREIAKVMFRRLTERGIGKRDTRAPAKLGDIAEVAGVEVESVLPVVEAFRRPDRSFVGPPVGTPITADTLLDIGHESLIRQWRMLAEWVDLESRSSTMYGRMLQWAHLWSAGEAALWRNPDLERALRWEQSEHPTPAWARRYGTAEEFELAMRFLRASEAAWREEERKQNEERQLRYQEDVERQTREEREKRLVAEAKVGRASRRIAIVTTVLMVVLALGWAKAWLNAREAQTERMRSEKEAQAASEARGRAEYLLKRLTNSERIKRAFLTNDAAAIKQLVEENSPLSTLFGARRQALGWKTGSGQPVYRWDLYPLPEALDGPLRGATQISYFMDHPTFNQKLLTAGPGDRFTASYNGWGCLSKVYVLIEYASPDTPPQAISYPMCDVLKE
jgi:hypothetical protein